MALGDAGAAVGWAWARGTRRVTTRTSSSIADAAAQHHPFLLSHSAKRHSGRCLRLLNANAGQNTAPSPCVGTMMRGRRRARVVQV